MSTFNKWVRIIHRWLVIPFTTAIIILLIGTIQGGAGYVSPMWLGALGIGSILSLALTGLVMFATHYIARARRAERSKQAVPAAQPKI